MDSFLVSFSFSLFRRFDRKGDREVGKKLRGKSIVMGYEIECLRWKLKKYESRIN